MDSFHAMTYTHISDTTRILHLHDETAGASETRRACIRPSRTQLSHWLCIWLELESTMHQSIFAYKTFYSDVFHLPCPKPKALALFIPGNPGLISYYTDYLTKLQGLSDNQLDVYAISHLGHTMNSPRSHGIASLAEQIDSKLAFLKTLPNELPVVLIGHSFGSWLSGQVRLIAAIRIRLIAIADAEELTQRTSDFALCNRFQSGNNAEWALPQASLQALFHRTARLVVFLPQLRPYSHSPVCSQVGHRLFARRLHPNGSLVG
jgi:pimeloyl-ACP methyl ester carboxylesterase